ncbi:hypothetical protein WICPIJ_009228 [Wickerhamomyces pijperi]|uniref:Uncharacterized protein n=1 Tax=Wickerhamomyces pijperi TaxID=599730 RepID=A0A9P8PQD7_WICPI|nr:hypothetical protein WICPIJ_009228 [Wickerhamomyces pijperi]
MALPMDPSPTIPAVRPLGETTFLPPILTPLATVPVLLHGNPVFVLISKVEETALAAVMVFVERSVLSRKEVNLKVDNVNCKATSATSSAQPSPTLHKLIPFSLRASGLKISEPTHGYETTSKDLGKCGM